MFYLEKKARIFFDKSVVFKTELAKLFIETMKIDVDSNLYLEIRYLDSDRYAMIVNSWADDLGYEENVEQNNFKYGENFKIIIPITNMITEGNFNIKVNGKVATKPILYAYSEDTNLQDYALTGNIYEDGSGVKTVKYTKNETKIIVLKQGENGKPLEGVKFRLLDKNKDVLYTEFVSDKDGKIIIENLAPGTYYLEETSTVNGYAVYEEEIEAKLDYNEELTINN